MTTSRIVFLLTNACLFLMLETSCVAPAKSSQGLLPFSSPENFTSAGGSNAPIPHGWLDEFKDAALKEAVQEAINHNYNLKAAAERVEAARATVRGVRALRLPAATGNAGASRSKRVVELDGGRIEDAYSNQFNLGANVVWELDLWGKLGNRSRAALADFQATEADFQFARLSLAANIAKAWFDAVESELQVRLARESLASFESNLEVVERGYKLGVTRALDVRLTRANVESARGNLQLRTRLRDLAARTLEVLLGRYPADDIQVGQSLPELNRDVPPGVPSDLLERRPDLVAAERDLAASLERLRASKKALLPSISLTGSGGAGSSELRDLLDLERLVWTLASNLSQPIFQGGRLRADIQFSQAVKNQALANYAQTALNAFLEVEVFLAAETYLKDQETGLQTAARESILAEELAWQQYQRGLADIITVLESQRRSFNSRSSLLQTANDRLQNRINLHLALGGDFEPRQPTQNTLTKRE